jgi:hypothetical protein
MVDKFVDQDAKKEHFSIQMEFQKKSIVQATKNNISVNQRELKIIEQKKEPHQEDLKGL